MLSVRVVSSALLLLGGLSGTIAFDNSRFDNVAVYWGQNSYGAVNGADTANFQKRLSVYCQDNSIDVIPIAFVNVFFGPGGVPSMNLANTCNPTDNATFPGTNLPNCQSLASDIKTCQSKGKILTLSLGGATGSVGFQSDDQANQFAQTIWNLFLGGSSSTRPFGDAVLDGVDLDIEGGTSDHYATFVNGIRSRASGGKKYYITAAPQCVYPDGALGGVLNSANFDAVYAQFYNNPCGLTHFNEPNGWNFGIWDQWARTVSPNSNVKVYIGAPASSTAAGSGYVDPTTLKNIAVQMRNSFPSFGGVMLWDASQAVHNGNYHTAIKNALVAAGGTGFNFPSCSGKQQWTSGTNYPGNSEVAFGGGHLWTANWWTQGDTPGGSSGAWKDSGACLVSRVFRR
ncbi:glycoside hydrolase family 18 protein [Marasmius fiardii PR-910]|nr:glycoside hydrolase family 18 protein [Marasmius fiardii PR-910]